LPESGRVELRKKRLGEGHAVKLTIAHKNFVRVFFIVAKPIFQVGARDLNPGEM
jgi:hypothetical protein